MPEVLTPDEEYANWKAPRFSEASDRDQEALKLQVGDQTFVCGQRVRIERNKTKATEDDWVFRGFDQAGRIIVTKEGVGGKSIDPEKFLLWQKAESTRETEHRIINIGDRVKVVRNKTNAVEDDWLVKDMRGDRITVEKRIDDEHVLEKTVSLKKFSEWQRTGTSESVH